MKHLYAFCKNNDIIIDEIHKSDEKYVDKQIQLLFNSINKDIDIDVNVDFSYCSGFHFVIGSSQMNKNTPPLSVSDSVAYLLSSNNKDDLPYSNGVITFGRDDTCELDIGSKTKHIKWDLSPATTTDPNVFDTAIDEIFTFPELKDIIDTEGLTIYFTFGSHIPEENIIIMDTFEKMFKESIQLKQLQAKNKVRLIVTGTDAINPSDSNTFYKCTKLPFAYGVSKLYQLVKCALLISYSDNLNNLLKYIVQILKYACILNIETEEEAIKSKRLTRYTEKALPILNNIQSTYIQSSNLQAEIFQTNILERKYDQYVRLIFLILDTTTNFSWAQNLSVMLTNMQISRWKKNPKIKSPGLDDIKNNITDHVLFKGSLMLTVKQAALEHINAFHRITRTNLLYTNRIID